jgi:hypothetical protein
MNGSSINDYFVRQPRCVENSPRLKSKLDDGLTAAAPGPWRMRPVSRAAGPTASGALRRHELRWREWDLMKLASSMRR